MIFSSTVPVNSIGSPKRRDLRPVRVAQHETALVAVARQVERGAEQLVDALSGPHHDEAALVVTHVVVFALGQRLEREVVAELGPAHAGDLDAQPEPVGLFLGRPAARGSSRARSR